MKNNRNGFAMVLALCLLLIATVAGTTVLFLTQKDRVSSTDYFSKDAAGQSVQVALAGFEATCANSPTLTFSILEKFLTDQSFCWLLAPSVAKANIESKILIPKTNQKYSVKILAFDTTNYFLSLQVFGYAGNALKKAYASYRIAGIANVHGGSAKSTALYLGGTLENCSSPINIKGDVYVSMKGSSTNQHFNTGGTIDGNLKTGNTSNYFDINKKMVVTGKAYLRSPMSVKDVFQVDGKSGFEKNFDPLDVQMDLRGDAFFNSNVTVPWNSTVNMNSNACKYTNWGFPASKVVNASEVTKVGSLDIAGELGMSSGDEHPDTIKMPSFTTDMIVDISSTAISGAEVDTFWCQQNKAGKLYKGSWLVLRLTTDVKTTGGSFHHKAIWMTENYCINSDGKFFDCADTSNTLIYVTGSGYIQDFGVPSGCKFRGYIFVNTSSANVSYKFGTGSILYGAINHFSGRFNLQKDGELNIVYNSGSLGASAVEEIVSLGLLAPADVVVSVTPGFSLVDLKIRPTIVSISF
jgi:hypothetical protein